ncbi:dihydrodipicolinate synthase family protein [Oscillospiraceae bacterium PP1C4]
MKYLHGVITAMVTPFNEDGSVNLEKMANLTEFLIAKGVHCLYPLGTTGECMRISEAERKAIAQTVVKTADHRVTVYIHVGATTQEETIALAQHAHEIGADGIGVVTPSYFGANDRELEEFFVAVAKSVPEEFPVYMYGIPQCAANDISPEVAQRIAARCKNVVGIKYSYPDLLKMDRFLLINDDTFAVVPGTDRLFLSELAMGCAGVVSGISCVYPEPFVAVYKAFLENDIPKARKLQKVATRYCETLKNGSNMSYFKIGLKMRGIDAGVMKAPQLDLTESEVKKFKDELDVLNREAADLFE